MEQFRYETHLHTNEASACALSCGADYVPLYQKAGYQGLIVTDHFFNGNTSIPSSWSWQRRVEAFCKGYEHAKLLGDQLDFSVFFGWETSFGNDEYLIYGLDKQWLLDNPEVMEWDHETLYSRVDADGGCIIQAHPFRERSYLSAINLYPHVVHGIEVVNGENEPEFDRKAYAYAKAFNLAMTSGSDIHSAGKIGNTLKGMVFDEPLHSIHDFVAAIKEHSTYHLIGEDERFDPPEMKTSFLPIYLHTQSTSKEIEAESIWKGSNR